ncbi:MAG: 4Fe-4S dicluster domain-containing protein [Candidatus Hydrogenedentota bacterium]|nr:MAG: 4Fe-4S dicluster domain-containing protein [Candidatus Hydrogenedentota bacterium]
MPELEEERRRFFEAAMAAAGATFLGALPSRAAAIPRESVAGVLDAPEPLAEGSILERMRADLNRALTKPIEQRRWVMVIDLNKCVGCHACTVSCIAENVLPPGVLYRPVTETELGEYPNVRKRYLPRPCMHCENPPCVPPCPTGATYKRSDGIVAIDYDQCIGCRYCVTSCPYGARTFDWGEYYESGTPRISEYETRPSPEYGEDRRRLPNEPNRSPKGNARKCQFCLHRISVGMLPACVTTCIGGATYFGDGNDPESLVSELIGSLKTSRLKEDLGTHPQVYYLV